MTRILLAVDGTDLDDRVATATRRLFPDAQLFALNVQHPREAPVLPPNAPGGVAMSYVTAPDSVDDAAEHAQEIAVEQSPDAAVHLGEVGHRADRIVATAVEHQVDLIAVGHRHRGWWSRLFDPSVSADVTERAPVPVLVVTTD
jgi:nucleotide-binding universal stress UspA family protein